MAIRNKDGTVYRLRGPNPLLKTQDRWNDNIKLHNLNYSTVTVADEKTTKKIPNPFKVEEYKAPISIPEPQEKPAPPVPDPPEVPKRNITRIHCLPATLKHHRDELYDEEHMSIQYGDKFIFEAELLDSDGMQMIMWSAKDVGIGSILFPINRGGKWWRVADTTQSGVGHKLICIISDQQPSFASEGQA